MSIPTDIRAAARIHRTVTVDIEALYVALDKKRRDEKISWAEIGRLTGLDPGNRSWATRLARGKPLHIDTIAALLTWYGDADLTPYLRTPGEQQ